jgi:rare lipoprotein A
MALSARSRLRRASSITVIALCVGFLAACAGPQPQQAAKETRSKEYFPESVWGVKASPRVSDKKSNLPRGGGRDQTGKPYQVRGKMYYPKEEKNYKKVGYASWYGDAFHGRLTANGEIYDQTHLTAAHPTMPLPSYARVTNVKNGSSVIVRVNDRGPYSNGRVIDLSRRAAEMLDYTHHGTAQVQVEYVGRAPLDGRDDQYLIASYRPGNVAPDPSDGLPTGVMIAMNGSTPSNPQVGQPAAAFPGTLTDATPPQRTETVLTANVPGELVLPAFGPIAPERPSVGETRMALASMSYAPQENVPASQAFDVLVGSAKAPSGKGQADRILVEQAGAANPAAFVMAGTFAARVDAERVRQDLAPFGRAVLETARIDGVEMVSVNLYEDGRNSLDDMLVAAWRNGAPDAIAVRD